MFCLFTGIFFSVDEVNLNEEWYTLILKKFQKSIISSLCLHLNHWENGKCNSSSKENVGNPKKQRGSYSDLPSKTIYFSKKIWIVYYLVTQSLFLPSFRSETLSLSYFWPDPSQESIFTNNFYLFLLLDGKRVCIPSPKYTQDRQQLYLYKYFHPPWGRRHSEQIFIREKKLVFFSIRICIPYIVLIHNSAIDLIHSRLDLIHTRLDLIHNSARPHPQSASHPQLV
jgi:hypothetical protein